MGHIVRLARAEHVLILAWALAILRIAWPDAVPAPAGGIVMAAYLALALPRLQPRTYKLLAGLAGLTAVLATWADAWHLVLAALDRTLIFAAFFGTIVVLRATADRRPETAAARDLFRGFDAGQRTGAFLVGAHVMGALLVVGALAILAPIQGPDATDKERRTTAETSLRGFCLAALWSPFWLAMAIVYQFVPDVPLWQVIGSGLALSVIGLVMAHLMFARGVGLRELWQAMKGFAPIAPPVAVCALIITLVTTFSSMTSLQAVVVVTPLLCLAALLAVGSAAPLSAVGSVYQGVGRITDEVVLVIVSLALGRVMEKALSDAGLTTLIASMQLPPEAAIAIVIGITTAASLVGIHQLVSITVLLVVLAPLSSGVAGVLMSQAALMGWALASMVGLTAVSIATAGAMWRVPMNELSFGPNLRFVALYGLVTTLLLMAANRLFAGG